MQQLLRSTRICSFVAILAAVAGCASDDAADGTSVAGRAVYRDARTDHAGAAQDPAAPGATEVTVRVVVDGTAQLPDVDPSCALDPAGVFTATASGAVTLDDAGAYAGALGAATLTTPSGCAVPDLSGAVVTGAHVRAELAATTAHCDAYCAASARADAEASCGADATAADCRAQAEASALAECTATCASDTHVIVAEASLDAALLGALDADALRAGAFGELDADLTFDRVEDR